MKLYAAFLRGINVGGKNKVPMASLRQALAEAGYEQVRTLLQSGNVVLAADQKPGDLESRLEELIKSKFSLTIEVVVRTKEQLDKAIASNPFPKEAEAGPSHLLILFTRHQIASAAADALEKEIKGSELIRAAAGHAYIYYPDGAGRSSITPKLAERHLGPGGTARNWNTVQKVRDLFTDQ